MGRRVLDQECQRVVWSSHRISQATRAGGFRGPEAPRSAGWLCSYAWLCIHRSLVAYVC